MRIPLAERIRFKYAVIFAVVLFAAQQLEGTDLRFSTLCAAFVCMACLSFNAAGGFVYPSGTFIFFNAMLTVIVGVTYKLVLNEPGESNLKEPNVVMLAYCGSMVVFGLVAALVRRIAPKKGLLSGMSSGESMKKAAIGAFIFGAILEIMAYGRQEAGSFLAAIRQINYFTQMAILLGTFYQIKKTNGRESSNWIVWLSVCWSVFFGGFIGFSKAGFLTGPIAWLGAAIAAGHNFTRKQIIGCVVVFVFFQMFLVPYSQVGRNFRGEAPTFRSELQTAIHFLSDLGGTRDTYQTESLAEAEKSNSNAPHLYDEPQGFWDRLNIFGPDDALISYTDEGNYEGLFPTYIAFINIIPHFVWQDKPIYYAGNEYAREIGMIADDNEGTGISFSPIADAYHQVGWYGFILLAVIIFLLFMVMDSLSGDMRIAPWGLLFAVLCSHYANEGMIVGQIYISTYVALGVIFVALLSKYVLPIMTGILTNTERTSVIKAPNFVPRMRQQPRNSPSRPTHTPDTP